MACQSHAPSPIITLITDFGPADGTVGAMIGVIQSICPEAEVVNVTSEAQSSIPGVGSNRCPPMAVTGHGTFVGPDNGILSWAVRQAGETEWRQLQNPAYRIAPTGVTFDGRDLVAPVAAHMAAGADPATFGPVITTPNPIGLARAASGGKDD